jgi:anti-sigma factor RsiW
MKNMCSMHEKLGAYHDGELDAAAQQQMEIHLSQCPSCMVELASLRAMSQLFSAVPEPRLSQISMHRLYRKADYAMEEGLLRFARVLSGIAAVILVAASAGLIYRNSYSSEPQQPQVIPVAATDTAPWVEPVIASDSDSVTIAASSPAAETYLTEAGLTNEGF